MQDFEKLGVFYLGREYDLAADRPGENLLLYDSRDLTTHAVVVGMTGSGKTGLCIDLLEEAGMDHIPAIVIDPKGDISNLLLTFPDLSPEEFLPWVDLGEAKRAGMTIEQYARHEAEKWRKGLASWGIDGSRIRQLRETVDMQIYTPGSDAGRPLAILRSFAAPPAEIMQDTDAIRERISAAASGLLALLGINADPIRSREHILISNLLNHAWSQGRDLDLGSLIGLIQSPPFERVGVMDLETFYSSRDRMELAMTLNNLLASPSFATWMAGESLDIKRLLHTPEGKPRISILSIAHLSDAERMFFVTILLNEVLAWMRTQAGTSSLRAILYMDEVFGYFPPTANPPSKQPMLTLLKQARAFGLGVVLATQNPVDLDYKGLSNTGTWFLGRLQTERDKARVLEGLEGASAQTGSTFDRQKMEATLAGLGKRKFLMNNVHDNDSVVFETRWAMSWLRGPLTREQIRRLTAGNSADSEPETDQVVVPAPISPVAVAASAHSSAAPPPPTSEEALEEPKQDPRTLLPGNVQQLFVMPRGYVGRDQRLVYRPAIMACGRLHYVRSTYQVDEWIDRCFVATAEGNPTPGQLWTEAKPLNPGWELSDMPPEEAVFSDVPSPLLNAGNYTKWEKAFKSFLYRSQAAVLYRCKELKAYSKFGESLGDFKAELTHRAAEKRDAEMEKIRDRWTSKFATMKDRIRRAEEKVEVQTEQYQQSRLSSALHAGVSIMGALLGRKKVSATSVRSAGTSIRSMGRTSKEKADIARAKQELEELNAKLEEMDKEFQADLEAVKTKYDVDNLEIEELSLSPRKSDISVERMAVLWIPDVA